MYRSALAPSAFRGPLRPPGFDVRPRALYVPTGTEGGELVHVRGRAAARVVGVGVHRLSDLLAPLVPHKPYVTGRLRGRCDMSPTRAG
jgi:hypothetical protein